MSNINQDYYIMVRDFSLPHLIPFTMGSYGSSYRRILDKEYLNKPIEFKINNEFWESGGRPSDVIYDGDGLIISDKLKEDFFYNFHQTDRLMMHTAYFVSPSEEYFEGYWFIFRPDKPMNWLDIKNSRFEVHDLDNGIIEDIEKYHLNEKILNEIDKEGRMFFSWDYDDYGLSHQIIHKDIVEYILKFNRNMKFIPLPLFEDTMANQGPLPDFAI